VPPPLSLSLNVTGTDNYGCKWTTTAIVPIGQPPLSAFVITPSPMPLGASARNLSTNSSVTWNVGFPTVGLSSHYATLNSGPGVASGVNYYPIAAGTANISYTAITNSGCTYTATDDVDVNAPGAVLFDNLTYSTVSANWEACVGDSIRFTLSGLSFTPTHIRMRRLGSLDTVIALSTLTATFTGIAPNISGTVRFRLPNNISTGIVCFQDAISAPINIICSSQPFIANNPERGFTIAKSPICYDDTITIYKVPNNGTFSAFNIDTIAGIPSYISNTDLIIGDSLIAGAGLYSGVNPTQNNGGDYVRLIYNFTPQYSNGQSCPVALSITQDVFIRDNILISGSFPITDISAAPDSTFNLTANIQNIYPAPIAPYTSYTDTSFSGTYVRRNATTGNFEFLNGMSGRGDFLITLTMSNGGCPAEATISLFIQPKGIIPGLPAVICPAADTIRFKRDSSQAYVNSFQYFNPYYSVAYDRNALLTVEAYADRNIELIPGHFSGPYNPIPTNFPAPTLIPNAVAKPNGLNGNPENFDLLLPVIQTWMLSNSGSDTSFYVAMVYQSTHTSYYYTFSTTTGWSVFYTNTTTFYRTVIQRVVIPPLPDPIGVIDSLLNDNYCFYTPAFTVPVSPAYDPGFSTIRFTKIGLTPTYHTLPNGILDINNNPFFQDTINRTYIVNYAYTKYFGCTNTRADTFTVIASVDPYFIGPNSNNTYCVNQSEVFFNSYPSPTSGFGGSLSGSGMGVNNIGTATINNMFAPRQAGVGTHQIGYTYTDIFGCISSVQIPITVRPKPVVSLVADRASRNYCANDTAAFLTGTPSNSIFGTGIYYGPTIIADSIFRPNQAYLVDSTASAGGVRVWYEYTDAFGCRGADTIQLFIRTLPVLTINNLAPRYCQNAAVVTNLQGIDLTGIGGTGTFRGDGIIGSNSYSPSQAGAGLDTVWLLRTNIYGCRDSISRIVTVDSIPRPRINNLLPAYCINAPSFLLQASPIATPPLTTGIYTGLGVSFNSTTGTYSFVAQNAANSGGVGQNIVINYTFTDSRGCTGTARDTTIVNALPLGNSNLPTSYCVDAPIDTLRSSIIGGPFTFSYFRGGGIIDTALGRLSPSAAAAAGFGLKTVTFYFTDSNSCQNIAARNYILNDLPSVTIAGLNPGYCTNNNLVNLQGFPSGTIGANANFYTNLPLSTVFNVTSATNARASVNPAAGVTANSTYHLIYEYRDGNNCTNRDTNLIEFFAPPVPSISNLAPQYCEMQDTFLLAASPAVGSFSGPGTLQGTNYFMPFRAGNGTHTVSYTSSNTNIVSFVPDTVGCTAVYAQQVIVRPLPVPSIVSPINNASFCENDPMSRIYGTIQNISSLADSAYQGVGVFDSIVLIPLFIPGVGNVLIPDTIHFFNPALSGPGTHIVTYKATNTFGCVDSARYSYIVYAVPQPNFLIDSVFCESEPPVFLSGTPAGGVFTLNGSALATNVYYPNQGYPSVLLPAQKRDTLIYSANNAQCTARDTNYVLVNPNPIVGYQGFSDGILSDRACLGTDTINLVPNIAGGTFSGSCILFGTASFIANVSGVGLHKVSYFYTNVSTGCSDSYTDTFYVYSTPNVNFAVDGGCGDTSIIFIPDNGILGLNGNFLGNLFDSITLVQWAFGDGLTRNDAPIGNQNQLDSIHHLYASAGIYTVVLYVENQNFCVGADTVRVIVSPAETPTAAIPYTEDFELTNGGWYEEAESGNASSNLWAWGLAPGPRIRTNNDPEHLNVWTTNILQRPYPQNAAGWVYSPCVDLTQLDRPMLKLDYFNDTDPGNDGVVVEYYDKNSNRWLPLGNVNRGINWYNDPVIAGRPGLQDLAPRGWSGLSSGWKDGRYKLDDFRSYDNFRFRVAFGAVGVSSTYEGFAFDNVWVGNRTRNVLLEHFSNVGVTNFDAMNNHVYDLVYGTSLVHDVVLAQFNTAGPIFDQFNGANPADVSGRVLGYGGFEQSGKAAIDGKRFSSTSASATLQDINFEHDMLESPKFDIQLNNVQIFNGTVRATAVVTANENMPLETYYVQMLVLEDSMSYFSGEGVHSVMRKMIPNAAGIDYQRAWATGDSETLTENWSFNSTDLRAQNMNVVTFIEIDGTEEREIYQVVSTRDITNYAAALGTPEAEAAVTASEEILNMNLYPNPTQAQITIEFDAALSKDFNWEIYDLLGRRLQGGIVTEGTQKMTVDGLDNWAEGVYLFIVRDPKFTVQKKFVVRR